MSVDTTRPGSAPERPDKPPAWAVLVLLTTALAGLVTWLLAGDMNLAVAVAGLVLALFQEARE